MNNNFEWNNAAFVYDVEQAIMNCWNVVDDINTICDLWDQTTDENRKQVLRGMAALYQMKFDDLFTNKFEPLLKQYTKLSARKLRLDETLMGNDY